MNVYLLNLNQPLPPRQPQTQQTALAGGRGACCPHGGPAFEVALIHMNKLFMVPPRWAQPECQMVISSRPALSLAMLSSDFLSFKVSSRQETVGRLASKSGLVGLELSQSRMPPRLGRGSAWTGTWALILVVTIAFTPTPQAPVTQPPPQSSTLKSQRSANHGLSGWPVRRASCVLLDSPFLFMNIEVLEWGTGSCPHSRRGPEGRTEERAGTGWTPSQGEWPSLHGKRQRDARVLTLSPLMSFPQTRRWLCILDTAKGQGAGEGRGRTSPWQQTLPAP